MDLQSRVGAGRREGRIKGNVWVCSGYLDSLERTLQASPFKMARLFVLLGQDLQNRHLRTSVQFYILSPVCFCHYRLTQNQRWGHKWIQTTSDFLNKLNTPTLYSTASPRCHKKSVCCSRILPAASTYEYVTYTWMLSIKTHICRPATNTVCSFTLHLVAHKSSWNLHGQTSKCKHLLWCMLLF